MAAATKAKLKSLQVLSYYRNSEGVVFEIIGERKTADAKEMEYLVRNITRPLGADGDWWKMERLQDFTFIARFKD